jgi:molecular chaperone GrpE
MNHMRANAPSELPEEPPAEATEGADAAETAPAPTAEELAAKVAALEAENAELKDRMLRALADTENLRRRSARDVEDARKYAVTSFARELLDVADNLGRALASLPAEPAARDELTQTLADGVAMTQRTLAAIFERQQIKPVEPKVGDRFDHNLHQAMFETETDAQPAGTIAQVLQPGYVIADRLLRPALVGVAKRPAQPAGAAAEGAAAQRVDTSA